MTYEKPQTLEEAFEKFSPFLFKLAKTTWQKHRHRITSYDDLIQSIRYLFIYAYKMHDPAKGPFKAYMKTIVTQKLKHMLAGGNPPWCKESPFTFLKQRKIDCIYLEDEDVLDSLCQKQM
ncbi:sigma factor [Pseudothermotoga thermarum]|uniref:Uncharacterized protein n=1 Tax=Pseudothermotoga thermarum DSM 5069 TaxID=688269 RepID=F7YVK1_9THEM|nr:sigma factor [Pseudothermotoga thermarum]AEH51656.1 hypothetical protein Theth_1604 [Pseudothermotoga thermarum DSM 5069]